MTVSPVITVLVSIFGTATVSCFGWIFQRAFTLGTRVTILETQRDDLSKLLDAKFDPLNSRLDRIERAMNGAFSRHN